MISLTTRTLTGPKAQRLWSHLTAAVICVNDSRVPQWDSSFVIQLTFCINKVEMPLKAQLGISGRHVLTTSLMTQRQSWVSSFRCVCWLGACVCYRAYEDLQYIHVDLILDSLWVGAVQPSGVQFTTGGGGSLQHTHTHTSFKCS